MNTDPMTLERFADLLDRHGGELARWPQDERAQADVLLGTSAEARRLHTEAVRLDVALDQALPELDSAALPTLKRSIMARIAPQLAEDSAIIRFWNWLAGGPRLAQVVLVRPAVLAMIPLLLGFGLGLSVSQPFDPVDTEFATELTLLALTDRYEGYADAQ
jgi:hypothetical protein